MEAAGRRRWLAAALSLACLIGAVPLASASQHEGPTVESASPSDGSYEVEHGESFEVEIECTDDPEGDEVHGEFKKDGRVVGTDADTYLDDPSHEFEFGSAGSYSLSGACVDDNGDGYNPVFWDVTYGMQNERPRDERVRPDSVDGPVEPGTSITFEVRCEDPDGDDLTTHWQVSRAKSFGDPDTQVDSAEGHIDDGSGTDAQTFTFEKEDRDYSVSVSCTDPRGEESGGVPWFLETAGDDQGGSEEGSDRESNGDDSDGDGVANQYDNCPDVANSNQADRDGDGDGDACDQTDDRADTDGDGIPDPEDRCPEKTGPSELDGCRPSITFQEAPHWAETGREARIIWSVSGMDAEVQETNLYWADFSVPESPTRADYGNRTDGHATGEEPSDRYVASPTFQEIGIRHLRVRAVVEGHEFWSDETAVKVGPQGIDQVVSGGLSLEGSSIRVPDGRIQSANLSIELSQSVTIRNQSILEDGGTQVGTLASNRTHLRGWEIGPAGHIAVNGNGTDLGVFHGTSRIGENGTLVFESGAIWSFGQGAGLSFPETLKIAPNQTRHGSRELPSLAPPFDLGRLHVDPAGKGSLALGASNLPFKGVVQLEGLEAKQFTGYAAQNRAILEPVRFPPEELQERPSTQTEEVGTPEPPDMEPTASQQLIFGFNNFPADRIDRADEGRTNSPGSEVAKTWFDRKGLHLGDSLLGPNGKLQIDEIATDARVRGLAVTSGEALRIWGEVQAGNQSISSRQLVDWQDGETETGRPFVFEPGQEAPMFRTKTGTDVPLPTFLVLSSTEADGIVPLLSLPTPTPGDGFGTGWTVALLPMLAAGGAVSFRRVEEETERADKEPGSRGDSEERESGLANRWRLVAVLGGLLSALGLTVAPWFNLGGTGASLMDVTQQGLALSALEVMGGLFASTWSGLTILVGLPLALLGIGAPWFEVKRARSSLHLGLAILLAGISLTGLYQASSRVAIGSLSYGPFLVLGGFALIGLGVLRGMPKEVDATGLDPGWGRWLGAAVLVTVLSGISALAVSNGVWFAIPILFAVAGFSASVLHRGNPLWTLAVAVGSFWLFAGWLTWLGPGWGALDSIPALWPPAGSDITQTQTLWVFTAILSVTATLPLWIVGLSYRVPPSAPQQSTSWAPEGGGMTSARPSTDAASSHAQGSDVDSQLEKPESSLKNDPSDPASGPEARTGEPSGEAEAASTPESRQESGSSEPWEASLDNRESPGEGLAGPSSGSREGDPEESSPGTRSGASPTPGSMPPDQSVSDPESEPERPGRSTGEVSGQSPGSASRGVSVTPTTPPHPADSIA